MFRKIKQLNKLADYFGLTDKLVNHYIFGYTLIYLSCSFVFIPSLNASYELTNISNSIIIYLLCTAIPTTIISFFGLRLFSLNKLKCILISSLAFFVFSNLLLILCYRMKFIVCFFVICFLKSAAIALYAPLSDTLVNLTFSHDTKSFSRIHSFITWLTYLGMTIMAFAGAWFSNLYGFVNTLIIQALVICGVIIIYVFINVTTLALKQPLKQNGNKIRYPTIINYQVVSHLLRSIVPGILNSLMPIWGLTVLSLNSKEYGFIYSMSGVFLILGGVVCNMSFCNKEIEKKNSTVLLSTLTIYSLLLFISFIKEDSQWFLIWLCAACFFAMISWISQKIYYLRFNISKTNSEVSAFSYSFYQRFGMLLGLIIAMLINSYLDTQYLIYINSIFLIVSGIILIIPKITVKESLVIQEEA
ncbi:MAG: hypothetical protein ABH859_07590 [Pseudomonadota bacterium]